MLKYDSWHGLINVGHYYGDGTNTNTVCLGHSVLQTKGTSRTQLDRLHAQSIDYTRCVCERPCLKHKHIDTIDASSSVSGRLGERVHGREGGSKIGIALHWSGVVGAVMPWCSSVDCCTQPPFPHPAGITRNLAITLRTGQTKQHTRTLIYTKLSSVTAYKGIAF